MAAVANQQAKSFYVGVDKHRWWKEAVVYQVSRFMSSKKYIVVMILTTF